MLPPIFFVPAVADKLFRTRGAIRVGSCVEGHDFTGCLAHAHNYEDTPFFGWICVRSVDLVGRYQRQADGTYHVVEPNPVIFHETAHILSPNHSHDAMWRYVMKELQEEYGPRWRGARKLEHQAHGTYSNDCSKGVTSQR